MTRRAPDDRDLLVAPLEAFGLPVNWRPARGTQTFSVHYDAEDRVMEIVALGDTWTPLVARESGAGPVEAARIGAQTVAAFLDAAG